MKTTLKQFIKEDIPEATSMQELRHSVSHGRFTLDGRSIDNASDLVHCSVRNLELSTLKGCPLTVGNFSCSNNLLKDLKFGPTTVAGDYFCGSNNLKSLEGAPKEIKATFNCRNNRLEALVSAPIITGGSFICDNNPLTSLEGAPHHIGTGLHGGHFSCDRTHLESLKDIHKRILSIHGPASFINVPIKSHILGLLKIAHLEGVNFGSKNSDVARIINKYLPEGDIFACQQELIDAGLEEFAQL